MVNQFLNWSQRLYFSTKISKSKIMNMNKCYFRYVQQKEKVDISFLLDIKGTVKQFNLSRNPSETLRLLLNRIKTNVIKVVNIPKKKSQTTDCNNDIEVQFYDNNTKVINENITCKELFSNKDGVKLKIFESEFDVIFNSPWVLTINLPESILAGFPVYPEKFETMYTKQEKCDFTWYKGLSINSEGKEINKLHIKWNLASKQRIYTPSTEDIGMKLKLECTPGMSLTFL